MKDSELFKTMDTQKKSTEELEKELDSLECYREFYMTLGTDQPYYPGYFICYAKDENTARLYTSSALNGRWCGTYDLLDKVHPNDRNLRGIITQNGIYERTI